MIPKVILSKRTARKLEDLLDYLESEWSLKVKTEFIVKLDKTIRLIQENPDCFPNSETMKGLHKCVITKQTTIYYRYNKSQINVITLFDNRQDPRKLKKHIL